MTGLLGSGFSLRSRRVSAHDEAAALETMFAQGWTDGLPVVVPTPERVEAMMMFAGGMDPDVVVGVVGPAEGQATVEKIAVNAVMAGCTQDYFPVVLAAVEAVTDPAFNLGPVQATTHALGPAVFVNGPVRRECGIASGTGALGPGHRANATIGRALRLVMMNVGGGRPGTGDMALLGQPGKFTCCMAEAEEESPFEPLHVALGYPSGQSTVTVLAGEAPHSVVCFIDPESDDNSGRIIRALATSLSGLASNPAFMQRGMNAVILNPDHADELARSGLTRRDLQERLFELAGHRRAELRGYGGPLVPEGGADDDWLPIVRDPADFLVLVGGGRGVYSMVVPSWGGGPLGNVAVTKPVRAEKACTVPMSAS
jgi:hypothetical protein